MAKRDRQVTAEMVEAATEKRFKAPEYALLWQVGNATGTRCNRHADAVAMSLWPSRRLELHGIEIKVSRADWLKELENPAKAEAIAKYCHRWWLAVGDADIVREGELPAGWGLLVLDGDTLRCKKEAPTLNPEAVTLEFVAALLRKGHEIISQREQNAELRGYNRGIADKPQPTPTDSVEMHWKRSHDELRRVVDAFQAESGVKIDRWNVGDIGRAVSTLLSHHRRGADDATNRLDIAADQLEAAAKQLRREQKTLEQALKLMPPKELGEGTAAE